MQEHPEDTNGHGPEPREEKGNDGRGELGALTRRPKKRKE